MRITRRCGRMGRKAAGSGPDCFLRQPQTSAHSNQQERFMHVIDISPVYRIANDAILTLLGGVATFIAAWFTWLLHKYAPPFVDAQLEAKAANDLNTALSNGVAV